MDIEIEVEGDEELAAQRRQMLDEFGDALKKDLQEAVQWRRPFEQRWIEAERQYNDGRTHLSDAQKTVGGTYASPNTLPPHQRATDNITKPIVRKMDARTRNMLFGTDETQFDIEVNARNGMGSFTTDPELAAETMEKTIGGQLAASSYPTHGRAVLHDGHKVGTGIIFGPFPKIVTEKIGTTAMALDGRPVTTFEYKEKKTAGAVRLDFRRFYPKPARNMEECTGAFMLDLMTRKQLEKLKKDPNCDEGQLDRILEDKAPQFDSLFETPAMSANGEMLATMKDKYPFWKFFGPVETKNITALNAEYQDEKATVDAEVWMCQGVVVKVVPRDGEDRLPFHVYNYQKDPESIFGFGVPHELANDQFDVDLAWGSMKLNAMASAMPIVGIIKSYIDDENGQMSWPPRKPIYFTGDDLSKAIQMLAIPNNTQAITEIYDRAKSNAENHAMVQSIEQDAPARADVGAAMFAMLKIDQNIVTADVAVNWDDNITKPLVEAMIDFELAYGDDPANKGAFDVIPKAATHLLTKDIQAQQAMQVLALADNPANTPFYKRYELNKIVVSRTNIPADQVMNTKEEAEAIQQQQAEQPNPEMMKLEIQERIETMKAQNDLQIAQLKAQSDQLVAQMTLEAASIKAASDEVMTAQEQDSRNRIAALTLQSKAFAEELKDSREREKNASKVALEAEKLASNEAKVQIELANERPFRTQ